MASGGCSKGVLPEVTACRALGGNLVEFSGGPSRESSVPYTSTPTKPDVGGCTCIKIGGVHLSVPSFLAAGWSKGWVSRKVKDKLGHPD